MELILREFQPEDAARLCRIADNEKIACRLRNVFPHPYTLGAAEFFINLCREEDPAKSLTLAVCVNGQIAGCVGLTLGQDVNEKSAEIGYWLAEEYWGKGIMSRAVELICRRGFSEYDLNRIYGEVFSNNKASMRVLEKCGFVHEGTLRKSVYKNGEVLDAELYALTEPKGMLEITFGESGAGLLKVARKKALPRNEIACLPLALDIGDISAVGDFSSRACLYERLFREFFPETEEGAGGIGAHMRRFENLLQDADWVRVWYSEKIPGEVCGLLHLMGLLRKKGCGVSVVQCARTIEVRPGTAMEILGLGELDPEWVRSILSGEQILDEEALAACEARWEQLVRENAPLRACVRGEVRSVQEGFYDGMILSYTRPEFEQVARVIGRILSEERPGVGDWLIASRIKALIRMGLLEVEEKPDRFYQWEIKKR